MKNCNSNSIPSIGWVLVWVLTLGFSGPAFGANDNPRDLPLPSEDAQVAALLAERPFEERVWTLYRIGKEKRAGLISNLIERLDLDRYPKYEAELALDALFKLEAFVPDEVLLKLLNDFPTKAAIMLAFKPERHATGILTVFERLAGSEGAGHFPLAAFTANLGLKAETPGFAHSVLSRRLELAENKCVTDLVVRRRIPPSEGEWGAIGSYGGPACRIPGADDPFPPLRFVRLIAEEAGGQSFVEGPTGVSIAIMECPPWTLPPASAPSGFSSTGTEKVVFRKNAVKILAVFERFFDGYLSALAKERSCFRYTETVVWKGRRVFARQVEQARTDGEANFRRIVNRLVEKGLLTRTDADNFKPEFVVRILNPDDLRIPQLPQTVPGDRK